MSAEFNKIYNHVVTILDTKLPSYLTYHNAKHTLYVLEKTIYIANKEEMTGSSLVLLKVAALFHDIGFINSHIDHEEEGCRIARKELKHFNINKEDIEVICNMIKATKIPQKPKTKLEMILADADLEYLSTTKFKRVGNALFKELKHFNPELNRQQWDRIQIEFLKKHHYHTSFCKKFKEHKKQRHLNKLIALNK